MESAIVAAASSVEPELPEGSIDGWVGQGLLLCCWDACSASFEKAVKRLPCIRQAVVDVLNNRAQVPFYPSFVNVSSAFFFSRRLLAILIGFI